MEQRLGEVYLNDFSSGLITKKAYGRTDFDLHIKGLPNINNAKTNLFGNIENHKLVLEQISQIDFTGYETALDEIKKGNYTIGYHENYSTEFNYYVKDFYLFTNTNNTSGYSFMVTVDLNKKTISSIMKSFYYEDSYFGGLKQLKIKKIFCFDGEKVYFKAGFLRYNGDEEIEMVFSTEFYSNSATSIGSFSYTRPYSSNLKASGDYNVENLELYYNFPSGISASKPDTILFKYDIRKNVAEIQFVVKSGETIIYPINYDNYGNISNLEYATKNYKALVEFGELELFLGKFVFNPDINSSFTEYTILKTPYKDTTKVDSSGNITVEQIALQPKEVFYRETLKTNEFSSLINDVFINENRLFVVRLNKLYASKFDDFRNFYNTTNSAIEGFQLDLPFETLYNYYAYNDLILFSNRGTFFLEGNANPSKLNIKQIGTVTSSKTIKPMAVYNGVSFVDDNNKRLYFIKYVDEVGNYEVSDLTLTIDIGEIKVLDYVNNNILKESIVINDEENTYIFSLNETEQYKAWSKNDKINFDFTYFDELGNTIYCECDTVNKKIIEKDDSVSYESFEFELFKPDLYKGEKTPLFFNRNLIVKGIEIMYTGNGKIFVDNGSEGAKTVVDKRIFFNDTSFYQPFDEDVKIAKAENLHFQWGNKLSFGVQTEEEFRIYAIKLIFVL